MKFAVGYQLRTDRNFLDLIIANKARISEVYFSWYGIPNGRSSHTCMENWLPYEVQECQIKDFRELASNTIPLNLLLNGNCYGKNSLSRTFFCTLGDTVNHLKEQFGLKAVTTASPLIARFLKENFAEIDVRASVNLGIASPQGMEYIAPWFDSFYLRREYNRNLKKMQEAGEWCKKNNKKLYLLANSGCLNDCSAQTFHDNLVAHEEEIAAMDNAYAFEGICKTYLQDPNNRISLIRDTNFIRPEDIHLVEPYVTGVKLATRVHTQPEAVLQAYLHGRYNGAVTELLEPCHSGLLYPVVLENHKLPIDFGHRVMTCDKQCETCGYCAQVYRQALTDLGGMIDADQ